MDTKEKAPFLKPPKTLGEKKKRGARVMRVLRKLFPDAKIALHYKTPWELVVAVELSAQCTDKKVNQITPMLFKKYKNLDAYVHADPREFEKDIHATGFFRAKTRNILAAAKVIKDRYKGKIPKTMKELVTVPGVGRKSANVILGNLYGVCEGIAVDTHVQRLARVFGLTDQATPEKIERDLMAIFPKKDWCAITYQIIEYGRAYCIAKPHVHKDCPLAKIAE
jgi:endonuclease-3